MAKWQIHFCLAGSSSASKSVSFLCTMCPLNHKIRLLLRQTNKKANGMLQSIIRSLIIATALNNACQNATRLANSQRQTAGKR